MESWGPGMHSFDALTLNFWEIVQHISPLNKHCWHFLVPPSGPTSGAKRCWKMESWAPGTQSFDSSTMNFGEVVQHTSPLDKHYWYFLVPPSGPTSGTKVCWKMESWGPFDTSIMNFGEVVQLTSPLNKHYWHFQIPPSGPASDSWECWNIEAWGPGLHSFDASTMNFGEVVQHTSPLNKH